MDLRKGHSVVDNDDGDPRTLPLPIVCVHVARRGLITVVHMRPPSKFNSQNYDKKMVDRITPPIEIHKVRPRLNQRREDDEMIVQALAQVAIKKFVGPPTPPPLR